MSFAVVWVMRKGGRFASRKIVYAAFLALACLLALASVALHFAPSEEAAKELSHAESPGPPNGRICSPP